MATNTKVRDYYGALVGKTVKEVRFVEDVGRCDDFPVLVFTDGTEATVQCDPEGNGAGFLFLTEPVPVCGTCEKTIQAGESYYEVKKRNTATGETKTVPRCLSCQKAVEKAFKKIDANIAARKAAKS